MNASFEIQNLNKSFGKIKAVNNLSLCAHKGELIALLGPNGAGKSTLMNMMTGFLAPDSGTIKIFSNNLAVDPLLCKKQIGFLPEGSPLYYDMSVKSFLNYMAELKSVNLAEVTRVMALANIDGIADQKIETLSKGYKRRVGFALSLLGNPPILLLDEPTDGLDPNQKEHMLSLISEMAKDKTIMVSTHLLDEAKSIANRILIMNKGTIQADGSLDAVLHQARATSLEKAFTKLTRLSTND